MADEYNGTIESVAIHDKKVNAEAFSKTFIENYDKNKKEFDEATKQTRGS